MYKSEELQEVERKSLKKAFDHLRTQSKHRKSLNPRQVLKLKTFLKHEVTNALKL